MTAVEALPGPSPHIGERPRLSLVEPTVSEPESARSPNRPPTAYDRLLDVTTEFLGQDQSAGIEMPSGLVCIRTGLSRGVKSWAYALPPTEPGLDDRVSKVVVRFAEFPDGTLYEDRSTLPNPLTADRVELENFGDIQPLDMINLGFVQEAIEDRMLQERGYPLVAPNGELG